MENQRVFLRPVFLLLAAFSCALAQNLYVAFAVDDKITFDLNPPASAEITRLVWKHGANLVGDWTGGEFSFFGTFKGRTTIDPTSGSLEIQNATKSDSGWYEVEVNNVIQAQRYAVTVIRKVPKPSIWITPVACPPSSGRCSLQCEGKTDESEPVTYSWREEDGDWKEGTNFLDIGNETESIKTFTCLIQNPVSKEMSKPKENPFFREPLIPENSGDVGLGVALGVFVVAAAAAAGVVYWKRDPIMRYISRFTGNGGGSNGDGQKEPTADPASGERMPLTENGRQDPRAGPTSEEPRPRAGPTSEEPRPSAGPTSEEPRPSAGPTSEEPRPSAGPTSEEPRPSAGPTSEEPRPSAGPTSEEPRPSAGQNREDPELSVKL